jgi:CheY-like chemotaxis protein
MISEKQRRPVKLNHVRVLVVEDHTDAAELMRSAVSRLGCEARVCQAGTEALEAASDYQPHVALLDLNLPDIDGCQVGRSLRQQPGLDKMALVAISCQAGKDDWRRSNDAGFDLHVLHPVRPDVLHSVLARVEQSAW